MSRDAIEQLVGALDQFQQEDVQHAESRQASAISGVLSEDKHHEREASATSVSLAVCSIKVTPSR